jgi:heme/copper-type cytochrome/quinol oxidase subunit 3
MTDATLALPPAPQPRRRELIFGTVFATAGICMAMATLIGVYLSQRGAAGTDWLAENNIPLAQPNMQLLTLAMSVVTMQWAVWSIARDDRNHTYLALGVTLLLGAAFVNQTTFLYSQVGVAMSQPEGPLFYAVTGGQLAMTVGAMAFLALMAFRALAGSFGSRQPDGIAAAAVFWYAAVAVYAVVWLAVYIMK